MQFKQNRHLVDANRTTQSWSNWLTTNRGKTIKLPIFEYGVGITRAPDLEAFRQACIVHLKLIALVLPLK